MAAARAASVRLYSVDYVLETLTSDPEAYRVIDVTFYATEYERRLHWDLLGGALRRGGARGEPRGAQRGLRLHHARPARPRGPGRGTRRRLGIAAGRPVVLLMSLKMAVPEPYRRYVWSDGLRGSRARRWRRSRSRGPRARDLEGQWLPRAVDAVREFCRRSGAALVVKSREKNRDPRFLRRGRGRVRGDRRRRCIPYTSIELMAIADLCVHFQSGAALEAALAAVPSLSVKVPQSHLRGVSRARGGVRRPRGHAPELRGRGVGRGARGGAGPAAGRYPRRLQDRPGGAAALPRALRGRRRRAQQPPGAGRHRAVDR